MDGIVASNIAGSATTAIPQSTTEGTAASVGIVNGMMSGYTGFKANKATVSKISKVGKAAKSFTPAALASGAIVAPFQHGVEKKYEESKDDSKFSAKKFVGMAAPAAASTYLGAGVASNLMESAKNFTAGSSSAKDIMKKTLAPKEIHKGFKREVSSVKNTFVGKGKLPGRIAKGVFGATLLGLDGLQPLQYAYNTLSGRNKKKANQGEPNVKNS